MNNNTQDSLVSKPFATSSKYAYESSLQPDNSNNTKKSTNNLPETSMSSISPSIPIKESNKSLIHKDKLTTTSLLQLVLFSSAEISNVHIYSTLSFYIACSIFYSKSSSNVCLFSETSQFQRNLLLIISCNYTNVSEIQYHGNPSLSIKSISYAFNSRSFPSIKSIL